MKWFYMAYKRTIGSIVLLFLMAIICLLVVWDEAIWMIIKPMDYAKRLIKLGDDVQNWVDSERKNQKHIKPPR